MRRSFLWIAVLALAAACHNSSSSSPTEPPPPAATTITILGENGSSSFAPNPATATAGKTIEWKNNDVNTHRIVSNTAGVFDTGDIAAGATSKAVTVSQPGSYPYHCSLHTSMTGTLNVNQ